MFAKTILLLAVALALVLVTGPVSAADAPKPLKVLLVTGGCCHDYAKQKDILKKGIEARVNAQVDIIFIADDSTHPHLPIYGHPDYAKGYDVVIHDECAADVNDPAIVEGVLKPHRDGIPGVNLHCGMHCYRIGNPNDPVTPGARWTGGRKEATRTRAAGARRHGIVGIADAITVHAAVEIDARDAIAVGLEHTFYNSRIIHVRAHSSWITTS